MLQSCQESGALTSKAILPTHQTHTFCAEGAPAVGTLVHNGMLGGDWGYWLEVREGSHDHSEAQLVATGGVWDTIVVRHLYTLGTH